MGMGIDTGRPPENAEHPSYTMVYLAAGGWQSMCVWWNPDPELGPCEEPWSTGKGPYRHKREAIQEATDWAKAWGIQFRLHQDVAGGPEEAPSLDETIESMGFELHEIEADPEEPFDGATRQELLDVRAWMRQGAAESERDDQGDIDALREALEGAADELVRDHGYRMVALDGPPSSQSDPGESGGKVET